MKNINIVIFFVSLVLIGFLLRKFNTLNMKELAKFFLVLFVEALLIVLAFSMMQMIVYFLNVHDTFTVALGIITSVAVILGCTWLMILTVKKAYG